MEAGRKPLEAAQEQRLQDLHARPPVVVVDWDGTCVPSAWPEQPRNWLKGAKEALHKLISAGYKVQIHSVRLHSLDVGLDQPNPSRETDYEYIREMLDEAGLVDVEIVEDNKPPAVVYIDDRAIAYKGDWEEVLRDPAFAFEVDPVVNVQADHYLALVAGLEAQGSRDTIPSESSKRKALPITSGVIDYFPAALAAVAAVSKAGNDKHNPGQELHHARGKSMDHADAIARHLIDRGNVDPETGMRHTAELAWRSLALLQEELEREEGAPLPRGAR